MPVDPGSVILRAAAIKGQLSQFLSLGNVMGSLVIHTDGDRCILKAPVSISALDDDDQKTQSYRCISALT